MMGALKPQRVPMRRWSFRSRLAFTIVLCLSIGAAVVLCAQYAVLSSLLGKQMTVEEAFQNGEVIETRTGQSDGGPQSFVLGEGEGWGSTSGPIWTHSDAIVDGVLRGVQAWSALILVAFVAFGWLVAWLIARSAVRRVSEVTDLAKNMDELGLSNRLALLGPVDEIRLLGDTFDSMLERLEAAFDRQERFIANAAHELRTPLAATRTSLQIAKRQGRVPPDFAAEVDGVLEDNARLSRLVDSLLVVARGQHARSALEIQFPAKIDFADLTSQVTRSQQVFAEQNGITIVEQDSLGCAAVVRGEGPLMQSALENVIANAVRHNFRGGSVWVNVEDLSGEVRVSVENTGIAYSALEAARLLEPFYRGPRSRVGEGDSQFANTGLGLPLAQGIVRLHGGCFDVDPREGGGLVVRLTMPLAD